VSAEIAPELTCRVVVVANDTERSAAATVVEASATSPIRVAYLHEPAAGKWSAFNRAIVKSSVRLLGFVDDDEEIGSQWFVEAANGFAAGDVVASILGVPRYLYGRALRGALDWLALSIRARQSNHRFAAELATWDLLGFQDGHYVYRDVDPIARLAPSLTEHAGCPDLPAGCSDLSAAVGA
jgi:glycosyltransferase involved in cell wall biosynthesis